MAKTLTSKEFLERVKSIHGDKYDYSEVDFKGTKVNVKIICPVHGAFQQKASGHLEGKGCIECGGRKHLTTAEFIEKAKVIYGEKFTYEKTEYVQSLKPVIITCPVHGDFVLTPSYFLRGKGCAKCTLAAKARPKARSKINRVQGYEQSIMDYMKQRNIQ